MPLDTGGQIRFMAENLLTTGVTAITSSAINPIFPIVNLTSNFRGRPVKFAGSFVIDSTNNKLYINDGSDKTATVASATYASRTALNTAMQTALNAVSSNFTVSWNTTLQSFVISKTANFVLKLSTATNSIATTIGFTGSSDLSGDDSYTADRKRFHWPYEYVKIDYGYSPDIGFLGLISDSRYIFSLTETATVKIQANSIDDFSAPPVNITLTVSDLGIFRFFDDDDYNYRYWRLLITDNDSTDDATIGYMYLGEFHRFGEEELTGINKRYNSQGASNYSDDTSEKSISESGQVYALEKQNQKFYEGIEIQMINPEGRDFLYDIWSRFKTVKPFFIAIDPKLEISNNLYDYTFFCNFLDRPKFTHQSGDRFNTSFGVSEWL